MKPLVFVALLLAAPTAPAGQRDALRVSAARVWINEIHYDNSSIDTNEGVEIAGSAGASLAEYRLFLYNGVNGLLYASHGLSGVIDHESNGRGALWIGLPRDGLQNGSPDGIVLAQLVEGATNVLQFISYEGVFTAVEGPAAGLESTDIGVAESSSSPVDFSLQLSGQGSIGADFEWVGPARHSRGSLNADQRIRLPATVIVLR